ncbi:hypothetical protein BN946_scf184945.g58 [Trametes cinnabarina]|uniref:Uncharacterized protein n=1 Tax=Pycnoporus cinnabarinus TaxID=5643 RepID=A0A060SLC8_PYCCI|nr:hypothetical protein BN946_scf184945.g58 [Trametes cinnabarina]
MARNNFDDGYVEDSEEEDIMTFGNSAPAAKAISSPAFMPPPPLPQRAEDSTVSSIQTADFTDFQSTTASRPIARGPDAPDHTAASTIQSPNFILNHSIISDISSFGPDTRPPVSSIRTGQTLPPVADTSISTTTSIPTSAPSAPRPKPRPRPAYRKRVVGDTSISAVSSSAAGPSRSAIDWSFPSDVPPGQPMGAPSHVPSSSSAATTASKAPSGKERVSDSGVDLADDDLLYTHDIAERAKLRSRERTQNKGKGKAQEISIDADVIELSSEDDELSLLPKSKSKPRPKPRAKKAMVEASEKAINSAAGSGKGSVSVVPPPRKRTKTTTALPDTGFESDVNTIPVPTSDFSIPAHIPVLHSSQLPPSDPPPSTASSAQTHPLSQDPNITKVADAARDLSPLSSPPLPMPRKRKRPTLPALGGLGSDDEARVGVRVGANIQGLSVDTAAKDLLPPPPQPSLNIVPETQPPSKLKTASRKKRADADKDWDDDAPPKPSKSRKKARTADDDDFGGGDDDDDWAASAGKGKSKAKKASKKAPPKEKKGKAKAKAKATAAKAVEEATDGVALPDLASAAGSKLDERSTEKENPLADDIETPLEPGAIGSGMSSGKKGTAKSKTQGKKRAIVLSDEEDGDEANGADISTNSVAVYIDSPIPPPGKKDGRMSPHGDQTSDMDTKENEKPALPSSSSSSVAAKPFTTPTSLTTPSGRSNFSHANRSYTISAKSTKHTPMSELIRRASAQPGSPFPTTARPTYSPLVKATKSTLRRIAPLHPNRRTPPPPPPRPPAPKKSKKMLELEEKWEMELQDTVEGWYAMSEEERASLRRAKRDAELGFFED